MAKFYEESERRTRVTRDETKHETRLEIDSKQCLHLEEIVECDLARIQGQTDSDISSRPFPAYQYGERDIR